MFIGSPTLVMRPCHCFCFTMYCPIQGSCPREWSPERPASRGRGGGGIRSVENESQAKPRQVSCPEGERHPPSRVRSAEGEGWYGCVTPTRIPTHPPPGDPGSGGFLRKETPEFFLRKTQETVICACWPEKILGFERQNGRNP